MFNNFYFVGGSSGTTGFIMTYTIPSADPTLTLPTTIGSLQSIEVDWGDGTINTWTEATTPTHTYSGVLSDTDFQVSIKGNFLNFGFANSGDKLKLKSIDNWGAYNYDLTAGFSGCVNLTTYNAIDYPLGISNLSSTFKSCSNFNGNISNWDVSNVINMTQMFSGATIFNQPIGNWNVQKVLTMQQMFFNARAFNQPIGNWNVQKVTNMLGMFQIARNFNQPIGNWNVQNVTSMNSMFRDARNFNQDISSWDVSNVTDMEAMFLTASAFNQPIGSWNVSNVTNMASMFFSATAFDQNIGSWDVQNVNVFVLFMGNKTDLNFSATNLDAIYNGWSALPSLVSGVNASFGTINYTSAGAAGRAILTGTYGWTITDGGQI